MPGDQQAVIAYLNDPSSYGGDIDRVEAIETHASLVFIAGDRVYKMKRAVKYAYLDFSTLELRRTACERELALNRRTAPGLYIDVRPLVRTAEGRLSFSENGEPVEWIVVMRRFDQALLFDALAKTKRLDRATINRLADHIARFHQLAEPRLDYGGASEMREIAEVQHQCLATAQQAGFAPAEVGGVLEKWRKQLSSVSGLLDWRRAAGKVRLCHGDLHLRNICLLDGQPTLFDCLEFSESLASIDVLYDLAFLVMDLEHRGLAQLANRVFNRYLDRSAEDKGLAAMPLFLSATALESAGADDAREETAAEARRYLDLAHRFLQPAPRRLIAVGGVSGTGKSTLAAGLAGELGLRPGARLLRSDVIRKLLLGVDPETPLPADAYTREAAGRVYDALRGRAAKALEAGYSVIIDAASLQPEERRSFAELGRALDVPFTGFWLEGRAERMAERIRARRGDPSDATPEILAEQLRHNPGPIDWVRLAADESRQDCLAAARRALALE
jgi:aminoglycoside phosphotransferase family enzyme/predicted kinase